LPDLEPNAPREKSETFFDSSRAGLMQTALAFTIWGFLPLYWKLLTRIPAHEILAHRIVWSCIFIFVLLAFLGRFNTLMPVIRDTNNLIKVILCGFLISGNWFTYIWAINSGYVVEASMGYYINPLMVIFLALIVLREKLTFLQFLALLCAGIGVAIITFQYGKVPWVALTLAVTFALYGLAKKTVNVEATAALALETAVVAPIALLYIVCRQFSGAGAVGSVSPGITLILFGSGFVTAVPLLWFAQGVKKIPFSTVGFLQYIAPTITLLLGILVFKESFTKVHLVSFEFIWCGLLLYSLSLTGRFRKFPWQKLPAGDSSGAAEP